MAEKERYRDRLRIWWKTAEGQRLPGNVERLQEAMKADRAKLYSLFAERPDRLELADTLVRLIENTMAFAHYTGFRRGYLVGLAIGKDEPTEDIVRLIMKNPKAEPKEICAILDNETISLPWPELNKKGRWSDFSSLPKVKMYLERRKAIAQQLLRIDEWEKIMRQHESARGKRRRN